MGAQAKAAGTGRMTADEYLLWSEGAAGRWELVDGKVVAQASERAAHARVKLEAVIALRRAIAAGGLGCEAFADGMAVRIDEATVFEPDALVRCGPRLPGEALEVPDPVLVGEVLSPSTRAVDVGRKLERYFDLPSLWHYLVLDPEGRTVVHHRRGEGGAIETRVLRAGGEGEEGAALVLDPPGLRLGCGALFEEA